MTPVSSAMRRRVSGAWGSARQASKHLPQLGPGYSLEENLLGSG